MAATRAAAAGNTGNAPAAEGRARAVPGGNGRGVRRVGEDGGGEPDGGEQSRRQEGRNREAEDDLVHDARKFMERVSFRRTGCGRRGRPRRPGRSQVVDSSSLRPRHLATLMGEVGKRLVTANVEPRADVAPPPGVASVPSYGPRGSRAGRRVPPTRAPSVGWARCSGPRRCSRRWIASTSFSPTSMAARKRSAKGDKAAATDSEPRALPTARRPARPLPRTRCSKRLRSAELPGIPRQLPSCQLGFGAKSRAASTSHW